VSPMLVHSYLVLLMLLYQLVSCESNVILSLSSLLNVIVSINVIWVQFLDCHYLVYIDCSVFLLVVKLASDISLWTVCYAHMVGVQLYQLFPVDAYTVALTPYTGQIIGQVNLIR